MALVVNFFLYSDFAYDSFKTDLTTREHWESSDGVYLLAFLHIEEIHGSIYDYVL
jgi:hypothetical protein